MIEIVGKPVRWQIPEATVRRSVNEFGLYFADKGD